MKKKLEKINSLLHDYVSSRNLNREDSNKLVKLLISDIEWYLQGDNIDDIVKIDIFEIGVKAWKTLFPSLASEEKVVKEEKKSFQFVYIAKDERVDNFYKIGKTVNISKRLQALKGGNPYIEVIASGCFHDAFKVEKVIHSQLKCYRDRGEWFYLSDEVFEAVVEEYSLSKHIN
jgi:hypothetical protein